MQKINKNNYAPIKFNKEIPILVSRKNEHRTTK